MKAICIKTCYIKDRYCEAGNVYEFPDGFPLDYFKRLDEPEVADMAETKIRTANDFFTCLYCGKQFKVRIALTGHMRSHLAKKKEVT